MEDGVVFGSGGHNVVPEPRAFLSEGDPLDGGVDRFRAWSCEDDLARVDAEGVRDTASGVIEGACRAAAEGVLAGGIAMTAVVQPRDHGFSRVGAKGSRCGVV
jgi:hypothetical protein